MSRAWRTYRTETEPPPEAVGRLLRRGRFPTVALREHAPDPGGQALSRLLRGRPPRRSSRAPLLLPVAALAVAVLVGRWISRPDPALDRRLDAPTHAEDALTADVVVRYSGAGGVTGTAKDAHIAWEVGTLEVDVTPGQGIALDVTTPEGRVEVTGTSFVVTRGPLGTEVRVSEGRVRVTCVGEPTRVAGPGDEALCLPTRAGGMLGRARTLKVGGAPSDVVLEAVRRGVTLAPPGDPIRGELEAVRLDVLISEGRYAEALAAADAYLLTGNPTRDAEIREIASELRAKP